MIELLHRVCFQFDFDLPDSFFLRYPSHVFRCNFQCDFEHFTEQYRTWHKPQRWNSRDFPSFAPHSGSSHVYKVTDFALFRAFADDFAALDWGGVSALLLSMSMSRSIGYTVSFCANSASSLSFSEFSFVPSQGDGMLASTGFISVPFRENIRISALIASRWFPPLRSFSERDANVTESLDGLPRETPKAELSSRSLHHFLNWLASAWLVDKSKRSSTIRACQALGVGC